MIPEVVIYVAALLALLMVGFFLFLRWGTRWRSTREERAREMPGDAYLKGGPPARVAMTRAVSIRARPETVWPWLAQLGRGAGWYSIDWLDNGGKTSARHIVSWVPEPRLGDASPIGYLRHIEPGRALVWWVKGVRFVGALTHLVVDIRLTPKNEGSRLVIRMSADAAGPMARFALLVFRFIDSIMARRQLLGIRERVERYGRGRACGAKNLQFAGAKPQSKTASFPILRRPNDRNRDGISLILNKKHVGEVFSKAPPMTQCLQDLSALKRAQGFA
jgi:hypothetical protein